MAQTNIKLGYIRDPESHEMYFPYTHFLGVVGLDEHVYDLIGGSVDNYIPLAGSSSITGNLTAATNNSIDLGDANHIWKTVYAGNVYTGSINSDSILFSNKTFSTTLNGVSISKNILANDNISLGNIYAPDTVGNQYQLLMSNGSGKPSWILPSLPSAVSGTSGLFKYTIGSGWSFDTNSYLYQIPFEPSIPSGHPQTELSTRFLFDENHSIFAGDNIVFNSVANGSGTIVGISIEAVSPTLDELSGVGSTETGYLKRYLNEATGTYAWELGSAITTVSSLAIKNSGDTVETFDPNTANGNIDISMVHSTGVETTQSTTASAGFKMTNGITTYYQKISTSALINDVADTLILNGNFN